jgi:dTDP-4-dehydrorhamnose reductase
VGDQVGCPTYAQDIAIAVVDILPQLNSCEEIIGIYHYCGDSACSWFEFAQEIFKQLNKYYQSIYQKHFGEYKPVPYKWMPKFVEATDASARTLNIYKKLNKSN